MNFERRKRIPEKSRCLLCEKPEIKYQIYGSPRLTAEVNNRGIQISKDMVSRTMRKDGIKSKIVKKYKTTTDSNHNLPVAEKIPNCELTADMRDRKWFSDITYIGTDEGWLYLAGIPDVYDGAIVV